MATSPAVMDRIDRLESPAFLRRARSGEPEALTELFERFGAMVFGVALKLAQCRDDASDVVQDVFMVLPRALRGYTGRGSLEGWIKTVAYRTAYRVNRSSRRRAEVPLDDVPLSAVAEEPPEHEARIALERALARVPHSLRAVLVMSVVEGYSHSEIASMLGITVGGSKMRLLRAKALMLELLEGTK